MVNYSEFPNNSMWKVGEVGMSSCCENCGWSEIIGSPIMCNYSGLRTWRDECCEAWKPKNVTDDKDMVAVVRCKDCKWYDERISICDNCGLPREQKFFCADGKRKD